MSREEKHKIEFYLFLLLTHANHLLLVDHVRVLFVYIIDCVMSLEFHLEVCQSNWHGMLIDEALEFLHDINVYGVFSWTQFDLAYLYYLHAVNLPRKKDSVQYIDRQKHSGSLDKHSFCIFVK